MEYGCPVCNGMTEPCRKCPKCGQAMEDAGMIEDYYGPYSPYENTALYEPPVFWGLAENFPCVHLFLCPECGYDERVGFEQMML